MNDPLAHYTAIQKAQKQLRAVLIGPPIIAFLIAGVFKVDEKLILTALPFAWFLPAIVLVFRLQALNNCPWCGLGYFSKNPMLQSNGIRMLSAKNCASCGMPEHGASP